MAERVTGTSPGVLWWAPAQENRQGRKQGESPLRRPRITPSAGLRSPWFSGKTGSLLGRSTLCLLGVVLSYSGAYGDSAHRGDKEIIALVEEEYSSLDDFRDRLTQLKEALIDRGDSRAVFAAMYSVLTERVSRGIEEGMFRDGEWTAALTVTFGNIYRQAFFDFETGHPERLAEAWWVAFEASESRDTTVSQLALLGVHAHINHDLPFAIAAVTPHQDRPDRFFDFYLTHVLIVDSIDAVEEVIAIFDPALGRLDDALGELDERVLRQILTQWRFQAWQRASLFDGSQPPYQEMRFAELLDLVTGHVAHLIRGDSWKPRPQGRPGVARTPARRTF
jgi:hypothetical protein